MSPRHRSSTFSAVLLAAAVAGGACSHEQSPTPATAASAPAPTAASRRAVAAAPTEAVEHEPVADRQPAIYFDFDSSLVRDDARPTLQQLGTELRKDGQAKLRIEGNCDELGTVEYNMALGEARARAAKTYLVHLGVPDRRIATVSYGSQRPKYAGHDDSDRAKNRRDDLLVK